MLDLKGRHTRILLGFEITAYRKIDGVQKKSPACRNKTHTKKQKNTAYIESCQYNTCSTPYVTVLQIESVDGNQCEISRTACRDLSTHFNHRQTNSEIIA